MTISGWTDGLFTTNEANFGGTATQGQDYDGPSATDMGTRTILYEPRFLNAARLSEGATYTITDDSAAEPDETITLAVPMFTYTGSDTISSGDPITITILANDGHSRVSLGGADATLSEGATVNVPVNFQDTAARTADAMVAFSITGTATAADYSVTTGGGVTFDASAATGSITIAASASAGAIPIAITADTSDDEGETLIVTLTTYTGGGSGILQAVDSAARTYTLVDSVRTLTVTGPASHAETDADSRVTYTVAIGDGDTAFAAATTVTWTVTPGSASADDFAALTGTIQFPAAATFAVTVIGDDLSEGDETFSVQVSVANASADGGTGYGAAADTTITDDDAVDGMSMTLRGPATVNELRSAEFTVDLGAEVTGSSVTVAISESLAPSGLTAADHYMLSPTRITIAPGQRSGVFTITATNGGGDNTPDRMLTLTLTATGGANTGDMAAITRTITITEDDPAAREARLDAPLASAGRGVGQLAAQAVAGRLAASVSGAAGANSLTIAGRSFAGAETLAAEVLAGGFTGDSAMELLRSSGFNLTGDGGGRGLNFWGGGDFVAAEGKHDGIEYDGDTSAFTLGIDTGWKNGLVGVAVSSSDGDTDFTVTADGMKSTLETEVTSVHPYLTRRFNRSQLWLTAGYGAGDAELREPDATIKTDVTVTTAGLGLTRAHGQLSGDISALYTRAELDAAASGGRALPKTTADSLRVAASGKARWVRGAFSPFVDFTVRHDSGDGDTGIAGDVGGGLEWRAPTVVVRLAGAATVSAEAAEESRASLTVRKSAGDFDLGLNLSADDSGLDTGRLLTGEWRF